MKMNRNNDDRTVDTEPYDFLFMDIVSATEVTGMVSTPPLDDAEAEDYSHLFSMPQMVGSCAQRAD